MLHHHLAGVVEIPSAVPSKRSNQSTVGILLGTTFQRGTDTSLGNGAGEIGGRGAPDPFRPSAPVPFVFHSLIWRSHSGSVVSSRSRRVSRSSKTRATSRLMSAATVNFSGKGTTTPVLVNSSQIAMGISVLLEQPQHDASQPEERDHRDRDGEGLHEHPRRRAGSNS
jgi:hypothetical protein